jgi:hypothetical protein
VDGRRGVYRATIDLHEAWPDFLGNMVTVRLPFSG